MKVNASEQNTKEYERVYPCLLEHIGEGSDGIGNTDWKGTIILALTDKDGIILFRPNTLYTIEVGKLHRKERSSFSDKSYWVDFFGTVELDNRVNA